MRTHKVVTFYCIFFISLCLMNGLFRLISPYATIYLQICHINIWIKSASCFRYHNIKGVMLNRALWITLIVTLLPTIALHCKRIVFQFRSTIKSRTLHSWYVQQQQHQHTKTHRETASLWYAEMHKSCTHH